mmetsp:Transcript_145495/g.464963  ORF Transcript_145495/g.464963 Transcript_145495/m.464963 type:complete len:256 (-) Transcript_145495:687-1454(-)
MRAMQISRCPCDASRSRLLDTGRRRTSPTPHCTSRPTGHASPPGCPPLPRCRCRSLLPPHWSPRATTRRRWFRWRQWRRRQQPQGAGVRRQVRRSTRHRRRLPEQSRPFDGRSSRHSVQGQLPEPIAFQHASLAASSLWLHTSVSTAQLPSARTSHVRLLQQHGTAAASNHSGPTTAGPVQPRSAQRAPRRSRWPPPARPWTKEVPPRKPSCPPPAQTAQCLLPAAASLERPVFSRSDPSACHLSRTHAGAVSPR